MEPGAQILPAWCAAPAPSPLQNTSSTELLSSQGDEPPGSLCLEQQPGARGKIPMNSYALLSAGCYFDVPGELLGAAGMWDSGIKGCRDVGCRHCRMYCVLWCGLPLGEVSLNKASNCFHSTRRCGKLAQISRAQLCTLDWCQTCVRTHVCALLAGKVF